jgi:DNA repair protein RecN (Recombination protein N)
MLLELRVRDFAIIDDLSLSLAPGFNVLSGETGAGKSIIVGALGLLLGDRGRPDQVRTGSERAQVEATFDASGVPDVLTALREQGIDGDDGLVFMRREVQAGGRSRAWINGSAVNVAALASVGRQLASIHGQHEAQSLLDPASQREVLDRFAGATQSALAVARTYQRLVDLRHKLADARGRRDELARKADYLRHVVGELASAKLVAGEEARLDEEASRLEHAEQLTSLASSALNVIGGDDGSISEQLSRVRKAVDAIERIDPSAARLREVVEGAEVVISELARDLSAYSNGIDIDPHRLSRINERRSVIFRLARKYGGSVESALDLLASARQELTRLDDSEGDIAGLEAEASGLDGTLRKEAAALTQVRRAGASRLSREVSALLPPLGMPAARFEVRVSEAKAITASGADDVTFMAQLNVGHGARELARVASGGELSRTMLALKTVLADLDGIPFLVFDEVDAGIGGEVALHVGDALRALARHHQIIVITHLPQIAARAHRHLTVRKLERGGAATAVVEPVEGKDREEEITRMLSGDARSRTGRVHARELLARSDTRT